jgi:uncharacterized repeat protein (TIGR01451 family)
MKRLVPALLSACILAAFAGRAAAGTTDGTLITNIAAGTFSGASGVGFRVSYQVTAWVYVQNPAVWIWKTASPTLQAPGGDVVFTACVKNQNAMVSAFNVTVTDALPVGFEFRAAGNTWPAGWVITNANGLAGPWAAGWPAVGQEPAWFLRWTMPVVGPSASGCVEFTARVL